MTNTPQPNQIPNYPKNGELHYLFRKTLTKADMQIGLVLTGNTAEFLQNLSDRVLVEEIYDKGMDYVPCYTPKYASSVTMKSGPGVQRSFKLKKAGWNQVANMNGFGIGVEIDCWVLYQPGEGTSDATVGTLSLLFQEAAN